MKSYPKPDFENDTRQKLKEYVMHNYRSLILVKASALSDMSIWLSPH